jgi:hypothetical protein
MNEYTITRNLMSSEGIDDAPKYEKVFIPEHKRLLVAPIIEEILDRTNRMIDINATDALDNKKNI